MKSTKHTVLALEFPLSATDLKKSTFNHSYWEKNADKFHTSHSVSWQDINMINLEISHISKYIKEKNLVLDAGCSNGYTTFEIAKRKNISLKAFDYSLKSIDYALKEQKKKDKQKKISFYHGNILNINEPNNTFDVAYTIRVIINLLTWQQQKKAIKEMHRVLKPGGLFLMSEAFQGSLKRLNALRALNNMNPLVMHDFNLYLKEEKVEKFVKPYFDIITIEKFSSIYYVASRFMRYLTVRKKDKDSFVNPFNSLFTDYEETDQSGDFGIQKLYVLKKKK
jgi:ubiquinone/menaquinone biosynthesis C-methylase UbiE